MIIQVAALGWQDCRFHGISHLAGLRLQPAQSTFPALTCTAQASFRTASDPRCHGMVANGSYSRILQKPSFWEQSANLVQGPRIWDAARANGQSVGLFFWQQSLGENADVIVSPAPIHFHHGGMAMASYTQPPALAHSLQRACGSFPLHRYWGPLASPHVGDGVVQHTLAALHQTHPSLAFIYLPTLDYDLQRFGPHHPRCRASFTALSRQIDQLARYAEAHQYELLIVGDYAIQEVTRPAVFPNRTLREAGFFRTRSIRGMAYPDFYAARAFALVDHAIAHVYVKDAQDVPSVAKCLKDSGGYAKVEVKSASSSWGHASAGEILLCAHEGSWCAYPWWSRAKEAPEYATHVDIHAKPGYDPCELFFGFQRGRLGTSLQTARVRGTHGCADSVAFASSISLPNLTENPSYIALASALQQALSPSSCNP